MFGWVLQGLAAALGWARVRETHGTDATAAGSAASLPDALLRPPCVAVAGRLVDLPADVIERIVGWLPAARAIAAANATARLFRGEPGGRSPVEHALRERTRMRGHERALPPALPACSCSWVGELLARERVFELARAFAYPAAASAADGQCLFSAFVGADGGVYTCGEEAVADAFGLATGGVRRCMAMGQPAPAHGGAPPVLVPTRVASLGAVRVRSVAAGWEHLLALSEAGAVYGCGRNECGQLGLGDPEDRGAFCRVRVPKAELIVGIAAGADHSLALSAAGCAYSWGANGCGQLGHSDGAGGRWVATPTRIDALGGVRLGGLSAGGGHTLLLSIGGGVFSCGSGIGGQLGHGDEVGCLVPRRIAALAAVRAVHVSAGWMHSLVVDAAGSAYSFGCGRLGCLGHGDHADQLVPRRIQSLPRHLTSVRAAGGFSASALLAADATVHTLGDSKHGRLAHGPAGEPRGHVNQVRALAGRPVLGCALGGSHSLFWTADGAVYACGRACAALGHNLSIERDLDQMQTPTRIGAGCLPRLRTDEGWLEGPS